MKSTKVLLLNPPINDIIETELPPYISRGSGNLPPLGLLYLVSALRKQKNVNVVFLDASEKKLSYEQLIVKIKEINPDIVGITTITHNLVSVVKTVKIIKSISPRIHINLGGPHVTLFANQSFLLPEIDSITLGDGERSFSLFILGEKPPGIYLRGEEISSPDIIEEIDHLEFPARDLVLKNKYRYVLAGKRKVATMISSRGCPFNCNFCLVSNFKYRRRSVSNVLKEIDLCIKQGFEEIYFVDDTFNADREWLLDFCSEIKKRDILWSCRARVANMDEDLIAELSKSNCIRIHFGVETPFQEGLNFFRKGITKKDIEKVFKWCQKYKIQTVAYFLIGTPVEKNREQVLETINFAIKLNPEYCLFNILAIYPKTDLYSQALEGKILNENCWEEFMRFPYKGFKIPFWEEFLKRKELLQLLKLAYFKFYFRPSRAYKIFKTLWKKE